MGGDAGGAGPGAPWDRRAALCHGQQTDPLLPSGRMHRLRHSVAPRDFAGQRRPSPSQPCPESLECPFQMAQALLGPQGPGLVALVDTPSGWWHAGLCTDGLQPDHELVTQQLVSFHGAPRMGRLSPSWEERLVWLRA